MAELKFPFAIQRLMRLSSGGIEVETAGDEL